MQQLSWMKPHLLAVTSDISQHHTMNLDLMTSRPYICACQAGRLFVISQQSDAPDLCYETCRKLLQEGTLQRRGRGGRPDPFSWRKSPPAENGVKA